MPPMRPPMFFPPRGGGMIPPGIAPRGIMGAANNAGAAGARGLFARQVQGAAVSAPRTGGILSSLFGRGGGVAAGNAATAARSVTGAATAAAQGGSSLTNIMNGTQKVLAAGERIVPMVRQVQQYGPLIKNLPSMWKMYRGLKAADTSTASEEATTDEQTESTSEEETLTAVQTANNSEETSIEKVDNSSVEASLPEAETKSESTKKSRGPKPSVPRLFI